MQLIEERLNIAEQPSNALGYSKWIWVHNYKILVEDQFYIFKKIVIENFLKYLIYFL